MKLSVTLTLLGAFCLVGYAANVPFEQLGQTFSQTNINLVWNAPTNDLSQSLWVYRVLPAEFSPPVISNLMILGSFSTKDEREIPGRPHTLSFAASDGKKTLWIDSERGFIDYANPKADNMKITEGVPDERQAFELATNYLPMFGIDRSQLAKKPNGDLRTYLTEETATLYKALGMPAYATNTHMRGVYFIRSLDGVDFVGTGGRGGCEIEFGHQAKVSRLILSWRKLEREKICHVAAPEGLLQWIREGKAVYEPSSDVDIDWPSVRKMTITKVTPFYFGEVYSEPQNTVYPFAMLEATVDTGQTNLTVYLHCPIIDETKP